MSSIYRSEEGRNRILAYYDKACTDMAATFEDRVVKTRFGDTHLLVAGPEDGEPLVIFHGGNVVNPLSLYWYTSLMGKYRVYAPDTIGHPGKSAETKLSPKDHSYGQWVVDMLDALGLEKVGMIGPSFGGGIILRVAAFAPERIDKAVLMVPASIAMSIWRPIKEIVGPMLAYRISPRRDWLVKSVQPMFTETVPEDMLDFVGDIYREVLIHPDMPKTATKTEMAGFTAPTMLIAAENDVFFPAKEIVPRAKAILPGLDEVHVLPGSGHFPSDAGIAQSAALIEAFLAKHSSGTRQAG